MRLLTLTVSFGILALSLFATKVDGTRPQVQEPTVIKAIPAVYPRIATLAKESGTVVIEVQIKADGTVADANVVDGHRLFRVAAQRSARNWVFNSITDPTLSRAARLTFSFKLIPRTVNPEELLPVFLPPYGVEIRGTTSGDKFQRNVDPPSGTKQKGQTKRP